MAEKESLTLKIAGRRDFAGLNRILFLLVVISVALSPLPAYLTLFTVLLVGAGWIARTLCFSKVNGIKLTLVIFADAPNRRRRIARNIVRRAPDDDPRVVNAMRPTLNVSDQRW